MRIRSGTTQEEAAEAFSCDVRTIQRYEAGEQFPGQVILLKMRKQYGCSYVELFPES